MRSWGSVRIVTVLFLGVAACSDGGTDTVTDLTEAADRTAAVDHVRYELTMEVGGGTVTIEPVVIGSGEQAGTDRHAISDPNQFLEALSGIPLDMADRSIEAYADGTTTYVRAPGLAAVAADGLVLPPPFEAMVALGGGWGVVDRSQVAAADVTTEVGGTGVDLASTGEFVRAIVDELAPAGTGEVRDEPVDLYEGITIFAVLDGATETVPDLLHGMLDAMLGEPYLDTEPVVEALGPVEIPVEIGVDDEGVVRRIAFALSYDFYAVLGRTLGAPPVNDTFGGPDGSTTLAIALHDVGDETITVERPAIEAPVNLTPWAVEQYGPRARRA